MIESLSNSCSALHDEMDFAFAQARSRQGACGTRLGPAASVALANDPRRTAMWCHEPNSPLETQLKKCAASKRPHSL